MKTKQIARAALIAAIYTALSIALAPISFGMIQMRISEALTLLPIFSPFYIVGVTLGCFLTNLIGMFMGTNILGGLDVIFGTLATLAAALSTYALRKQNVLIAALPPVIINALVIGAELTVVTGVFSMPVFLTQVSWVGLGQAGSCLIVGVVLVKYLQKNTQLKNRLFGE